MKPNLRMTIILPFFITLPARKIKNAEYFPAGKSAFQNPLINAFPSIGAVPVPAGFTRVPLNANSFGTWLRQLRLKEKNTVYLYNGKPKRNQDAQFAVLDISVGHSGLQQCADAVMRLRAEYLNSRHACGSILFRDNNHIAYTPVNCSNRLSFEKYLERVFEHCGTLSLEQQLLPLKKLSQLQPGDVLIRGGSPGHAMIVADMAENRAGKRIYLLAQSYMPAQDIHLVKNPQNGNFGNWYLLDNETIITPEYIFTPGHFRTWPETK